MKTSKIIWDQNKLIKLYNFSQQSGISFSRLFCYFCMVIIVSACSLWPSNGDRELSISHRFSNLPPGVNAVYLSHLLEVSKKRYVELKNAGARYCLPGQMLRVTKKQDLIEHEIDGELFHDARINLKDLFSHLYSIKKQVENKNPSKSCYEDYVVSHKETSQILGVWENSVEVDALMEDE